MTTESDPVPAQTDAMCCVRCSRSMSVDTASAKRCRYLLQLVRSNVDLDLPARVQVQPWSRQQTDSVQC